MGAVLILIDHIDGSIIRVMPDFIQEDKEVIGKFRRKIRGIDIDLDGGLIKVVLGEHWEPSPGTGYHLSPGLIWSINEDLLEVKNATFNNALPLADYLKKDSTAYPEDLKSAFNAITLSGPESNTFTVSKASIKKQWKKKYTTVKQRTLFQMIFKGRTPNFLKMLLAWRLLFVDREKRKDKDWTDRKNPLIELKKASSNNGPTGDLNRQIRLLKWKRLTLKMKYLVWLFSKRIKARKPAPPSSPPKAKNVSARIPDNILLAIVLGNTLENAVTLREVKEILQSIDLPLFGWCVEYKDRLYNWKGEETYEPIFSREFLKRTLDDMWFLSSRIFGANKLSYESLASQMREPDLLKVKSAVKRLWILSSSFPEKPAAPTTGDLKKELADGSVFWISDGYWRWSIKNRDQRHEVCTDANVDTMKTILENLGDPNGGIL
ncbi:MAG: hypothetical protein JXA71_19225 [Chitinispirillaceae bacterium]|nr:hypothetical protein [Chitinispirillaceae bacterium]